VARIDGVPEDCEGPLASIKGADGTDVLSFGDCMILAAPDLLAVAEELLYSFPDLAELLGGPHSSAAAGKLITAAREAVAKVKGSRAS
jgi:hypothetical protein